MVRKKRELTEEQKAAAIERLAKARAAKGPAQYKDIHPDVLALDEDDTFSMKNVRLWMKEAKARSASLNKDHRWNKVKGALSESLRLKGYVRHCEHYLKHGDWVSDYYGPNMEYKTVWKCVAMAYYPWGQPKRTKGVWYPDLGMAATQEQIDFENEEWAKERKSHK